MTTAPEAATAWERVRAAIDAGDPGLVADVVTTLDEAGRKQVAAELPGYLPVARQAANERHRLAWEAKEKADEEARQAFVAALIAQGWGAHEAHHAWWTSDEHSRRYDSDLPRSDVWVEPMRVAGAATLGGAAAVATWLFRRDYNLWRPQPETGPLLRAIAARPADWQADLAGRLALRLRGTRWNDDSAHLALQLLRRTGTPPPDHEPLVVAWVSQATESRHDGQAWTTPLESGALAGDPLLDALLPAFFTAEGVGRAARDSATAWAAELHRLAGTGRLDRALLLDGCLSRFLRGGTGNDLRVFARLHDLLDPSPEEVAARRRDYLALLPAAPGPVADLALTRLRGVGLPDPADFAEAVEGLLFRAEAKLVKAGLGWLDQTARAADGDLDHLAPALGSAFLCESYEVRSRAVRLAVRHAARFTPLGADAVRSSAEVLPPDLAAEIAGAFGEVQVTAPEDAFEPGTLPAAPAPAPAFPPPAELPHRGGLGGIDLERWLDWFVREGARSGGSGLPEPEHEYDRQRWAELYDREVWDQTSEWAEAMLREAATPGQEPPLPAPAAPPRPVGDLRRSFFVTSTDPAPADDPASAIEDALAPHDVPGVRAVVELAGEWGAEVRRGLMEGLEQMTGRREQELEPARDRLPRERSVSRPHLIMLRRCAEIHAALKAGTLPPYLLATPTRTDGHLDAAELVTRLEDYERTGVDALPLDLQQALLRLPRQVTTEVAARARALTSDAGRTLAGWLDKRPEPVVTVDWQMAHGWPHPTARITAHSTGLDLVDTLLSDPSTWRDHSHGRHMESWRLVAPTEPDVIAAYLLPHLVHVWERPYVFHTLVGELFELDGVPGEVTALIVAWLLAERAMWRAAERGTELLLQAAASGKFPAAECGRHLARVLRDSPLRPVEALATLEAAARQGAHREVWELLTAFLPAYLPGEGERVHSGHTRVLEFAVEAAAWAGATGYLPVVAAVAGRKGSSGYIRAARLLHTRLTT
ncbi:DUF6493 family protein [Nonomuraea sp. NPDC050328]|uniref:DUF7824 domain-containing protein n=1 Tax=Nonomuraea sp. NPDC050328 TaxID=3364361 RepID=UPI00379DCB8F